MNVLMINGSPRKGNTYRLLERLGDDVGALGHSVSILNLADREIKQCTGCYQCILAGKAFYAFGRSALESKIDVEAAR